MTITNADILIIGGGLYGCSTAYHLAKNGARNIVVLERKAVSSGGTAKSCAIVRTHYSIDTNMLHAVESLKVFANFECVLDSTRAGSERTAALAQLVSANDDQAVRALDAALVSEEPALRIAARNHLAFRDPVRAIESAVAALDRGTLREQQASIRLCASLANATDARASSKAAAALASLNERQIKGALAPALRLDLAEARGSVDTSQLAALALEGGDAVLGREVVMYHSGAACLRCHVVSGVGGHAGPALDGVGSRLNSPALLQSLTDPNAVIATGFGTPSAMPVMTSILSPREMRDVVAYLASLRGG